jgi:hypothetical protein
LNEKSQITQDTLYSEEKENIRNNERGNRTEEKHKIEATEKSSSFKSIPGFLEKKLKMPSKGDIPSNGLHFSCKKIPHFPLLNTVQGFIRQ